MMGSRERVRDETRLNVLRLLHNNPEMSTREIAAAAGISNGGAFYCLNALVEKGLVKLGNFSASKHKQRYAYLLTPRGIIEKSDLTRRFLARKLMEYEALKDEIETLSVEAEFQQDVERGPGG